MSKYDEFMVVELDPTDELSWQRFMLHYENDLAIEEEKEEENET